MKQKLLKGVGRFYFLLFIMFMIPVYVFSQSKQVTGVIKDGLNEALIGVSVTLKGTSTGTVTDVDGRYKLSVPNDDAILVFSYVGYNTIEEKVGNRVVIDLTLKENQHTLDEVVVVGFGTQKKVNLTGSIASIDQKLLADRPMSNVSAGLAGTLPGVTISQTSGLPGADNGKIRVRGVGTLNNSDPMVIVDGIESTMSNLDANDIESLTVLKDAASAAIYGSKASNGVILITTKRGKAGVTKIDYGGYAGWQSATNLPKYMGSYEYALLYNEAAANDGKRELPISNEKLEQFRNGTGVNTDWQDLLYQGSGFQTGHNISAKGGTEAIRYMASFGYMKQDGIIKHSSKEQYNFRTNLDIKLNPKLDAGVNIVYTRMELEEPTNSYVGGGVDQIIRQVNLIAPWIPYKDKNGDYGTNGDGNPIAWIDLNQKIRRKRNYFTGIGTLIYKPINGLSVKGVLSYKTYNQDENEHIKDIQYNPSKYHGPNKMYQKDTMDETVMTDIYATYEKSFAQKHYISVMGGFHSEYFHRKYTEAYRQNFPNNNISDINGGSDAGKSNKGYTRELSMLSWFGRATYNYSNRYLFEANVRYDGTSRFAKGNRWGAFPSFSAAWRMSEESFMESLKKTVTNLKLRASWGKLGNQSALNDYYPTITTMTGSKQSYPIGGTIQSGFASVYAKNPELKWESSRTWDFGLDFSLAKGIDVTIDYYDRLTSDILMKLPTPDTYALDDYWANAGKVSNRGVEISVNYNTKINNVTLSFGGNAAYNKNKIKNLGGLERFFDADDSRKMVAVGYPVNNLYGYKTNGLYQSDQDITNWDKGQNLIGKPKKGDLKYVDTNGDGVLDANDRVMLGSTDPKYTFGFNIGASYRGFDIMAFFQGVADVKGYLSTEAYGEINGDSGKPTTYWRKRWNEENTNTKVPRVSTRGKNAYSAAEKVSSYWQLNANYLRLKNLQVGYTFPKPITNKMNIEKLRIYYSGQNLFTITNFAKGWDPEAPIGRGSHYPQVMVNSFGIDITF